MYPPLLKKGDSNQESCIHSKHIYAMFISLLKKKTQCH